MEIRAFPHTMHFALCMHVFPSFYEHCVSLHSHVVDLNKPRAAHFMLFNVLLDMQLVLLKSKPNSPLPLSLSGS